MIPKVIHYCWFGGSPLPVLVRNSIKSWKLMCPDYDVVRWDESNFDVGQNSFCKKAYEERSWAFVSDYARLKIIYENGGVYLDTDVELLRSLDSLLTCECFIGVEQDIGLITTGLGFGAERGSRAVELMLTSYDNIDFDVSRKAELACPVLNSRALRPYGYVLSDEVVDLNGLTVFPPRYFDPISPGDTRFLLCDETYSIHHYSNSWGSRKDRIRRALIRFVGGERVAKLKRALHA